MTACLTSDLMEGLLRGAQVPEKPRRLSLTDHTVIFGVTTSTDKIVRELHHSLVGSRVPIVIVSRDNQRIPFGDPDTYKNVYCVYGEFTDAEVLARANVENARTAIILAGDEGDQHAVLTCLAVKVTQPGLHAIVEVRDPANERHLVRARADEVIHLDSTALIAQCALNNDVSSLFEELLTMQVDGNEIYLVPMPDRFIGFEFRAVARLLLDVRVILVGVMCAVEGSREAKGLPLTRTQPVIRMNPEPTHRFAQGEQLVTIAFTSPSLA